VADVNSPLKSQANSSLKDQVAIVTGGGRGIGAATAAALLARGVRVLICSRTTAELDRTAAELGSRFPYENGEKRIRTFAVDLSTTSAQTVFDEAEKAFGAPVSILVNNAGIGESRDLLALSEAEAASEWDRTQAINARVPFLLSREMLIRFRARKDPSARGSIVNIGSLGGIRSTDKFKGLAIYVASKFAVAGITEALAVEGREVGVRVNAVAPGAVDTEMLRKAAPHLKTETTPDDVARVIVGLCDPETSKAVSGAIIEIHSNL
jgi:NAD(P)-dependent dehydrogenase (short-subunit alcohol dehydrogenase family)